MIYLIKAIFKPNNPVCEGYIIFAYNDVFDLAADPGAFIAEVDAYAEGLAKALGFIYPEAIEPIAALANWPSMDYLALDNWKDPKRMILSFENGEY